MRLGLVADVHEAVESLQEALSHFRDHGVEEVVFLGDLCRMHHRLEESAALLEQAGAAGVWGNHDFGLCRHVDDELRQRFSARLIGFMATLQPTLVREDCLFAHVEPHLNPNDLMDLWNFDGPPRTKEQLARNFAAAPQRVLFSGHLHRWFLADEDGPIDWDGTTAVYLSPPRRYLVVLHAVVAGHCAVYDTVTGALEPIRLRVWEPPER